MRRCLQIFAEAQTLALLPGGVNSPVRAFKSVGGQPIIFESVNGPYCFDVDGNKVLNQSLASLVFLGDLQSSTYNNVPTDAWDISSRAILWKCIHVCQKCSLSELPSARAKPQSRMPGIIALLFAHAWH